MTRFHRGYETPTLKSNRPLASTVTTTAHLGHSWWQRCHACCGDGHYGELNSMNTQLNTRLSLSPNHVEGTRGHDVTDIHRTVGKGKQRRTPEATKDENGRNVIHVPLANGSHAILDDRDFFHLMDNDLSDQWLVNSNGKSNSYVRCWHRGNLVTIARLLIDAPAKSSVKILNGNHLDLRRRNLKLLTPPPPTPQPVWRPRS
jgi:hypothetical protein